MIECLECYCCYYVSLSLSLSSSSFSPHCLVLCPFCVPSLLQSALNTLRLDNSHFFLPWPAQSILQIHTIHMYLAASYTLLRSLSVLCTSPCSCFAHPRPHHHHQEQQHCRETHLEWLRCLFSRAACEI